MRRLLTLLDRYAEGIALAAGKATGIAVVVILALWVAERVL